MRVVPPTRPPSDVGLLPGRREPVAGCSATQAAARAVHIHFVSPVPTSFHTLTNGALMEPLSIISTVISTLESALNLREKAVKARDDRAVVSQILVWLRDAEITRQAALQLEEKVRSLMNENDALQKKVCELETRTRDLARYRLHKFPDAGVVYKLSENPNREASDIPHYICQPCADNRHQKSALQTVKKQGHVYLHCPECKTYYATGDTYAVAPRRVGPSRYMHIKR